jgi:hypothetical protein
MANNKSETEKQPEDEMFKGFITPQNFTLTATPKTQLKLTSVVPSKKLSSKKNKTPKAPKKSKTSQVNPEDLIAQLKLIIHSASVLLENYYKQKK